MARLALVAILLLALVPTLGRIAQARAAGAEAMPSWSVLCTMQGLRSVLLPATTPAHDPSGPWPPAPPGSDDCAYCPLLATAIVPIAAALSVSPVAPPPVLCTSIPAVMRSGPHPCGLGSRGPPLAS
jgi:hypothetical protein